MERTLNLLADGGCFFESPRWYDGRWWVSDLFRHRVVSVSPDGSQHEVANLPGQPSGIGWMPDGTMLVVSMKDRCIMRRAADDRLEVHADLADMCGGHLNDMVVDKIGRAYVGDFGFDMMSGQDPAPASLKRVDPDGTVEVVADGLLFPNGCAIAPDSRTLIVGESFGSRCTAFSISDDGSLSDRRVWAQLAPTPTLGTFADTAGQLSVSPDGICLDEEGCLWIADALGYRCIRVAPGGEIIDEIRSPDGLGIYACMIGGEQGQTLLMCAAPDFFEETRSAAKEAVLLTTRIGARRAGLP